MYKAEFQLTTDCNMDCVFCFNKGQQKDKLPKELILSQITNAMEEGLQYVWLTGGEPLLDTVKVTELLSYSKKQGLSTGVSTNGLLLSRYVQKLKRAGLDSVRVSLDSASKKNFEKQRGGVFEDVLKGIEAAGDSSVHTIIRITASEYNVDELAQILALSKQCSADMVEIKPVLPVGSADYSIMPSPRRFYNAFLQAKKAAEELGIPITCVCNHLPACEGYNVSPNVACQCSHSAIYVAASGEIMPCSYFPGEGRFNAYHDSVNTAWHSAFFERVRSERPERCKRCSEWETCRNGCPAVLHHNKALGHKFYEHIRGHLHNET